MSTIFSKPIELIGGLIGLLKKKPSVGDIATALVQTLIGGLTFWNEYSGADKFERIKQAWAEFDLQTGAEKDIIKDIPADQEEILFDGLKDAGLILSLWAAGYYGEKPTPAQIQSVLHSVPLLLPDKIAASLPVGMSADQVPEKWPTEKTAKEAVAQLRSNDALVSFQELRLHRIVLLALVDKQS